MIASWAAGVFLVALAFNVPQPPARDELVPRLLTEPPGPLRWEYPDCTRESVVLDGFTWSLCIFNMKWWW